MLLEIEFRIKTSKTVNSQQVWSGRTGSTKRPPMKIRKTTWLTLFSRELHYSIAYNWETDFPSKESVLARTLFDRGTERRLCCAAQLELPSVNSAANCLKQFQVLVTSSILPPLQLCYASKSNSPPKSFRVNNVFSKPSRGRPGRLTQRAWPLLSGA